MSHFQRMIAIPQEEYVQLSALQNVRQPLTQQFYNLESQYNQEARVADPYKRVILQSQTLDDMKQLKDQMRNYLSISTPKPYRTRAQALLESVSPFLRFNERGEIYDKDNNILANTRLEDLIQHAVRDRRRNISPTGWNYFLNLLTENNVPKSILNRGTIDEMEAGMSKPLSKWSSTIKQEPSIAKKSVKRLQTPKRKSERIRKQDPLEIFTKY